MFLCKNLYIVGGIYPDVSFIIACLHTIAAAVIFHMLFTFDMLALFNAKPQKE